MVQDKLLCGQFQIPGVCDNNKRTAVVCFTAGGFLGSLDNSICSRLSRRQQRPSMVGSRLFCPFLLSLFLYFHSALAQAKNDILDKKRYCERTRKQYDIEPGKSFGSLPQQLHAEYLHAQCYRYFCEPHPKAGRGVFQCVPLVNATTTPHQQ